MGGRRQKRPPANPLDYFPKQLFFLTIYLISILHSCNGFTKQYYNASMPEVRPTFVVNFDMATVICQHTENPDDLHLHDISILCDGKDDCFQNPAMNDERFPYCEHKCNTTCSHRGACLYDGHNAQCYCNAGFHGASCELIDVNECVGKPCHWLAHCQNTYGSYSCQCFNGFTGDGFHCEDIDECANGKANCPENSICVNLPGTYMCNCTDGYMPKGMPLEKCADIDECALKTYDCPAGKMCENVIGGYACVDSCDSGYVSINGSCIDVNECLNPHVCDKRAICTNTPGGHECICDAGFTGDGHTCFPLNDCSQNDAVCDRHGFCLGPLKTCLCQTGYTGDGMSCTDINECESLNNPCANNVDSKCVNIDGGYVCCDMNIDDNVCIKEKGVYCAGGCGTNAYCANQTCQCIPGYKGDPNEKCLDFNECEDSTTCKGVGEICVNMIGGHTCCGPNSPHEECKGLEIIRDQGSSKEKGRNSGTSGRNGRNLGESIEIGERNSVEGDDLDVESGGTRIVENILEEKNASGGFIFLAKGKNGFGKYYNYTIGKDEFETLACNETEPETICPEHSDCLQGQCKCRLGFEWRNYPFRCEDINECVRLEQPCPDEGEGWCMNTIGSYRCCMTGASSRDCKFDVGTHEKMNITGVEIPEGGEIVSETFAEEKHSDSGDIVVSKGKLRIGTGIGLGGLPTSQNSEWISRNETIWNENPLEEDHQNESGKKSATPENSHFESQNLHIPEGFSSPDPENPDEPFASTSISIVEEKHASGGGWFGIKGQGQSQNFAKNLKNLIEVQNFPSKNRTNTRFLGPEPNGFDGKEGDGPFGLGTPIKSGSLGSSKPENQNLGSFGSGIFDPNAAQTSTKKHSSGGTWFDTIGGPRVKNPRLEVGSNGEIIYPKNGSGHNPDGKLGPTLIVGPDGTIQRPNGSLENGSNFGPDGKPRNQKHFSAGKPENLTPKRGPDGDDEEEPDVTSLKNRFLNPDGTLKNPNLVKPKIGPDGRLEGIEIPDEFEHFLKNNLPNWTGPDDNGLGVGDKKSPNGFNPGLELVPGKKSSENPFTSKPDNSLKSVEPESKSNLSHGPTNPSWKTSSGASMEVLSGSDSDEWVVEPEGPTTTPNILAIPEEGELGLEISPKDFRRPTPNDTGLGIKGGNLNRQEVPKKIEENLETTTPNTEIDESDNFTFGDKDEKNKKTTTKKSPEPSSTEEVPENSKEKIQKGHLKPSTENMGTPSPSPLSEHTEESTLNTLKSTKTTESDEILKNSKETLQNGHLTTLGENSKVSTTPSSEPDINKNLPETTGKSSALPVSKNIFENSTPTISLTSTSSLNTLKSGFETTTTFEIPFSEKSITLTPKNLLPISTEKKTISDQTTTVRMPNIEIDGSEEPEGSEKDVKMENGTTKHGKSTIFEKTTTPTDNKTPTSGKAARIEEFTATMPFEITGGVEEEKLTTLKFTGPIKITNPTVSDSENFENTTFQQEKSTLSTINPSSTFSSHAVKIESGTTQPLETAKNLVTVTIPSFEPTPTKNPESEETGLVIERIFTKSNIKVTGQPTPNEISTQRTISMHEFAQKTSSTNKPNKILEPTQNPLLSSTETHKTTLVSNMHEQETPDLTTERTNRPWIFTRTSTSVLPASSTLATSSPSLLFSTSPTVLRSANTIPFEFPSSAIVETTSHGPTLYVNIHSKNNETTSSNDMTLPPRISDFTDEVSKTVEKVTETKISDIISDKVTEKGVTEETTEKIETEITTTPVVNFKTTNERVTPTISTTKLPEISTTSAQQKDFTQLIRETTKILIEEETPGWGLEISGRDIFNGPKKEEKITTEKTLPTESPEATTSISSPEISTTKKSKTTETESSEEIPSNEKESNVKSGRTTTITPKPNETTENVNTSKETTLVTENFTNSTRSHTEITNLPKTTLAPTISNIVTTASSTPNTGFLLIFTRLKNFPTNIVSTASTGISISTKIPEGESSEEISPKISSTSLKTTEIPTTTEKLPPTSTITYVETDSTTQKTDASTFPSTLQNTTLLTTSASSEISSLGPKTTVSTFSERTPNISEIPHNLVSNTAETPQPGEMGLVINSLHTPTTKKAATIEKTTKGSKTSSEEIPDDEQNPIVKSGRTTTPSFEITSKEFSTTQTTSEIEKTTPKSSTLHSTTLTTIEKHENLSTTILPTETTTLQTNGTTPIAGVTPPFSASTRPPSTSELLTSTITTSKPLSTTNLSNTSSEIYPITLSTGSNNFSTTISPKTTNVPLSEISTLMSILEEKLTSSIVFETSISVEDKSSTNPDEKETTQMLLELGENGMKTVTPAKETSTQASTTLEPRENAKITSVATNALASTISKESTIDSTTTTTSLKPKSIETTRGLEPITLPETISTVKFTGMETLPFETKATSREPLQTTEILSSTKTLAQTQQIETTTTSKPIEQKVTTIGIKTSEKTTEATTKRIVEITTSTTSISTPETTKNQISEKSKLPIRPPSTKPPAGPPSIGPPSGPTDEIEPSPPSTQNFLTTKKIGMVPIFETTENLITINTSKKLHETTLSTSVGPPSTKKLDISPPTVAVPIEPTASSPVETQKSTLLEEKIDSTTKKSLEIITTTPKQLSTKELESTTLVTTRNNEFSTNEPKKSMGTIKIDSTKITTKGLELIPFEETTTPQAQTTQKISKSTLQTTPKTSKAIPDDRKTNEFINKLSTTSPPAKTSEKTRGIEIITIEPEEEVKTTKKSEPNVTTKLATRFENLTTPSTLKYISEATTLEKVAEKSTSPLTDYHTTTYFPSTTQKSFETTANTQKLVPTARAKPDQKSEISTLPTTKNPTIDIHSSETAEHNHRADETMAPRTHPTLVNLETTTLENITTSNLANLTSTTKDLYYLTTNTLNLATLAPRKIQCTSSNECGNDAYCERRTGACRCYPGFRGTPPNTPCIDVNECDEGIATCDQTSRCENFIGGYTCLCTIGYRKLSNGTCADINECTERKGETCDTRAICTNLEGSFSCQCKLGYIGDGYTCIPMNKRHCTQKEWIQSDCGKNHLCLVDAHGNRDCDLCKNGFVMRNGVCSDIDECASSNSNLCHEDAVCHNTNGGYDCRCQPGYSGDGYVCADVDECAHNPCHPQALCSNLQGSFACQCPDGWAGDGFKECLNPVDRSCANKNEICPESNHSACLSVRVSNSLISVCECLPGFRYDKLSHKCEDINECLENRNNCDQATTICMNLPGSYKCVCGPGYDGNEGVCVDVDECRKTIAGCHVNAYCINRVGSVGCQCAPGYTGDGVVCEPLTHDVGVGIPTSECPSNWVDECKYFNKTCYIDDEEIPQCGSCLFGYQPMDGKCVGVHGDGECADPLKNNCHKNADCVDILPGKHFCVCRRGFLGDGLHCDDVDECTLPIRKGYGVCDTHATCTNTEGGYECRCKNGYVGNGFKCTNATNIHGGPSCWLNPGMCHKKARCLIDGQCECSAGYDGDGIKSCEPSVELKYNYTTITVQPIELPRHESPHDEPTSRNLKLLNTSTTPLPRCSEKDRTACHILATCDLSVGLCVCRRGFVGDGVNSCTKIWEDCVKDTSVCDDHAYCHQQSGQCRCIDGYIGDGIDCAVDKLDCRNNTNLCSEYGHCVKNRCVCKEGYTGDGLTCMSLIPASDSFHHNCSLCDARATCEQGACKCKEGYFGNGKICVPDLEDCVNYPGVCHINGHCDTEKRKCKCRKGFIGNGIDCSVRVSCKLDSSICHKDAVCLPEGRCVCKKDLVGDGMECKNVTNFIDDTRSYPNISQPIRFECPNDCGKNSECVNGACKCLAGYKYNAENNCMDIDECNMGLANCHSAALCTNLEGSYQCKCPEGYSGDGKDCYQQEQILPGIRIQCLADGMRLILTEEHVPFEGRVFVRGQTDNPYCSKTFSPLKQTEDPPTFHISTVHCDMQLEDNDTLATTVIIQKHAVFITEKAYAYRLRCQYPTATRRMMTHFNVSELTTESIFEKGGEPTCSLTVTNEENVTIDSATVGQVLKLQLSVYPNKTYAILPRNCYAMNLETGEKYSLTDAAGCAIDTMLFPEWTRVSQGLTQAVFRTFKWPDSSMIRFECDCSACIGMCPTVNCGRRRDALFKRRYRARFARSGRTLSKFNETDFPESGQLIPYVNEDFVDEDILLMKNLVAGNSSKIAFSSVVMVNENEEEQLAQKQLERWMALGSNYDVDIIQAPSLSNKVCIRTMWVVITLITLLLAAAMLTCMTLCYRHRSRSREPLMRMQHHKRDPTTLSEDVLAAYLKF